VRAWCRPDIPRGRHFQPFPAVTSDNFMVRDMVTVRIRVRVRVSRLVVAISRTIPCNDHDWRLSEWRTLRNGGQFHQALVGDVLKPRIN